MSMSLVEKLQKRDQGIAFFSDIMDTSYVQN